MNKHTIVALMQDRPGALNRAVSLFRRRGYNIESLAVGHTETPGVSRMTLVVESADVEQVVKQLYRLIEVLKVSDVTDDPTVEREMVLVKIHAPNDRRAEIVAMTSVFDAKDRRCRRKYDGDRDDRYAVEGRKFHRRDSSVWRERDDADGANCDGARGTWSWRAGL